MINLIAYIDPGSGSLIFQLLLTGIMGVAFAFRKTITVPFKYIYRIFRRLKKGSKDRKF